MHCMLMDLLHGFEVLSTTEETLFKMHHILQSTQIRVKQFEQNLPENYSKRIKITIRACKFSKVFRGNMLSDPP